MLLPLATCMVVITVSMVLLYRTVKRQEGAITTYTRQWLSGPSIIRGERGIRPSLVATICVLIVIFVGFLFAISCIVSYAITSSSHKLIFQSNYTHPIL